VLSIYYVSQKEYSWDCDVWHNRHLKLKIRMLTLGFLTRSRRSFNPTTTPFQALPPPTSACRVMEAGCEADLGDEMEMTGLEIMGGGCTGAEDTDTICLQLKTPKDAAFVIKEG
jgi:hypothetical protein